MKIKVNQNLFVKTIFALLIVYVNFIQYKIYQNSIIMILLGVLIVGIVVITACGVDGFRILRPITTLLVFSIYMVFPTIISENNLAIKEYITVLEYTAILICLVKFCTLIKDVEWLIRVKAFSSLVICIVFLFNPAIYHDKVNTIQYTLVSSLNPNTFSLDILIGLWSLLYLNAKKKISFAFSCVAMFLFVYCIFITAARKSFICALLIIVFWSLWIYLPGKGKQSNESIIIRLFIIMTVIAVTIAIVIKKLASSQMIVRIQSILNGGDGSLSSRLQMYLEGWRSLLKKPIFGYGFGGFEYLYGGYSHATLVEVPVSGGVIGAMIYGGFLFQVLLLTKRINDIKKHYKYEHISETMSYILCIIMLVLCVCVIHPYLFNSYIAFGIIISIYNISKENIVHVIKYED